MDKPEFFRRRHIELMRRDRIRKERKRELLKEIAVAALIIPGGLGWAVLLAILV